MTNVDYAGDLMFLTNIPAQAESLEQAAKSIGLYMKAKKTVYMF